MSSDFLFHQTTPIRQTLSDQMVCYKIPDTVWGFTQYAAHCQLYLHSKKELNQKLLDWINDPTTCGTNSAYLSVDSR